ncbi:thymidylate synthase [Klebsiella quasipneumoniae]|uniref:thymidylate synthase n=1 Tax=Klebsiella quasipneumoniae TaxID=1463165 RepID=UPI0023B08E46|nr:thymidylate synthase [Klebsiella quasipneumoniae]
MKTPEQQYLDLGERILEEGVWVENKRTGVRCLTVINADLEYDVGNGIVPVITTRPVPYRGGIGEFIGYLQGVDNAADLRALGSNTWNANANENESWLKNPHRKGEDDLGRIYGVQGRDWTNQFGARFDQLKKIINNLKQGIDDRGEIITFWNPGEFEYGCLRPCMHTHHFSLLGDTLYLNSTSRSFDLPLGGPANLLQAYLFLQLIAQVCNLKPGKVYHKVINAHIYENQVELFKKQLKRVPIKDATQLWINPDICSLEHIDKMTKNDVKLIGYFSDYDPIVYPFTV